MAAEEKDVCPHCGAVRDVLRATDGDATTVAAARRHKANVPAAGDDPA